MKMRTKIMLIATVVLLVITIMMMLAQASIVPSTGTHTPTAFAAPTAHYVTVSAPGPSYLATPTAMVTVSPYATKPAGG